MLGSSRWQYNSRLWTDWLMVLSSAVSLGYFTTDGQSVSMSWYRVHSGTCDQILFPVGMFLSESCGLVSVGRPLWREDRSTICSAITQWSKSRRTRNHTLPSHPRLPRARFQYLYPLGTRWPSYTPGHWFLLRHHAGHRYTTLARTT
jgi:hypothetical protein